MTTPGRRSGSRRGPRGDSGARSRGPALLTLSLGVTLAVVAWGYLVFAAIDFGVDARGGDSGAWGFLALASLGAVACLFIGLILVARLLARLAGPPRTPGGRRAAR